MSRLRRPLLYLLGMAFVLLIVLMAFSLFKSEQSIEGPPLQVQRVEDPEHAADAFKIVVPEERIPRDMDERLQSAPIALLPNHAGHPEARGEIKLPAAERAQLGQDLEQALSTWETFLPSDGYQDRYLKRLQPLVVPEALPAIVQRRDSNDAPDVCPEESCRIGQRWFRPGAISWFVIDKNQSRVYVVAYGAVIYRGDPASDSRALNSSSRSYGVIMRRSGEGWLLERVAAESLR